MLDPKELKEHADAIKARSTQLTTLELRRAQRKLRQEADEAADLDLREMLLAEHEALGALVEERLPPLPTPEEVSQTNPLVRWQMAYEALSAEADAMAAKCAEHTEQGRQPPGWQTQKLDQLQDQLRKFPANPLIVQQQQQQALRDQATAATEQSNNPSLTDEEVNALHDSAYTLSEQAAAVPLAFHDATPTPDNPIARAEAIVQQSQDSAA